MQETKVNWPYSQTDQLQMDVFNANTTWHDTPGLYIFTYFVKNSGWIPLYVGQTESFLDRLPTHERWTEAVQLGATHIHAVVIRQQVQRDSLEQALIEYLQPNLNQTYR